MDWGQQWQAFTHNKKAMAGAGAAAGLGLFVLWRRKKSTGSSTSSSSTGNGAGSSTPYVGSSTYPNSSGTDLATALGNMDSQYASQVAGYKDQLGSIQTALAGLQTSGGAVTTPDTSNYNPSYVPSGSSGSGSAGAFAGGGTTTGGTGSAGPGSTSAGGNAGTAQNGVTVPTGTPTQTAASSGPAKWHVVLPGEDWYKMAALAGTDLAAVLGLNSNRGPGALHAGDYIQIGGSANAPTPTPSYRRVQAGDNWINVAQGHNESEATLLALNYKRGPAGLHVGETIRVG